jgi:hypothetical protein
MFWATTSVTYRFTPPSSDLDDQNWGGYSLAEYEALERTYRISRFAQRPWLLSRR